MDSQWFLYKLGKKSDTIWESLQNSHDMHREACYHTEEEKSVAKRS